MRVVNEAVSHLTPRDIFPSIKKAFTAHLVSDNIACKGTVDECALEENETRVRDWN
jgi:hypothetical protein